MKKIFIFALFFCFVAGAAFGQYPANPNKIRLGNQTSGDGLVYRGSGAPAYTPSDYKNAWVYIDSVAGRMYTYRGGAWEFVSAGAGVDSLAYRNDSLFVYSPDTTFFVVIDRTITVAGSSGTPQTVDPGQTVTISNGFGITTTAGATRTVEVKADTSVLASKTYTANALALKLNLSDTATMLSPYQRDISLTTTGTSGAATFSSNILNIPQYQAALTNPVTGTGTTNYLAKFTGTSAIGNSLIQDDGAKVTVGGTAAIKVPTGTTVQRPGTPVTGEVRYNTTLGSFEGYGASAWLQNSFPAGTTSQTIRHDGTSWVASSNLYHDGTGVGIGATSLGSARLVLKNSQEPARSTVVATQGFAVDTTNWTKGTGWTFSGTTAVATAATGDLTYTPALTITSGNAYEVTYTISGYSAGTLTLAVGNATYALPTYNITGNVVVVLPTSATGGFRFTTSTFTGVLDNVTVVQIANPAPVLFAGQDDGATTLYNSVRMPNSSTWTQGGGGGYTTGSSNNFFGNQAGYSNTTGNSNNFFGNQAGYSNTTGSSNNFFGNQAGYSNTTGYSNNFFGENAGYSNTTGSSNNFFGNQAGRFNTTGYSNNFFGENAGYSNTTGNSNNFFGYNAGYSNTTGNSNNFFGYQAGYNTTAGDTLTGDRNTLIGYQVGNNIRLDADNNVAIGNDIDLPIQDGDNQLVLSNLIFGTGASGTGTTTAGKVGIRTNAPNRELEVAGEVRITDLTTDTPTRIVGADADGDLGQMRFGSEIGWKTGDTLAILQQGATSGQALAWNGSNWRPTTISASVSDGDKGDITVSSSGTVWNIDADVIGTTELADGAVATANITNNNVTLAKIQTISTNMLLGNDIGSDAAPSQLVVGNGIQLSNSGVRLGGHRVTTTNTSATVTSEIDSCGQLVVVATLASGAGADLTITLPNAGSSYLGREVLIYADDKDDDSTGGVDYNVIVTTTSGTYLYYGNGESGLGLNASYEIDPPATPTYVKLICVLDSSLNYKWIVLSY